jgi:hypothetical protein
VELEFQKKTIGIPTSLQKGERIMRWTFPYLFFLSISDSFILMKDNKI